MISDDITAIEAKQIPLSTAPADAGARAAASTTQGTLVSSKLSFFVDSRDATSVSESRRTSKQARGSRMVPRGVVGEGGVQALFGTPRLYPEDVAKGSPRRSSVASPRAAPASGTSPVSAVKPTLQTRKIPQSLLGREASLSLHPTLRLVVGYWGSGFLD